MKRGEIWWVDLGKPKGSAPGFRRPVVVVQDDLLTESRLATVMVAPLTSNLKRSAAAGNITLDTRASGLSQASVVLVCHVTTVDKSLFDERVGTLSKRRLRDIDEGLALALGLSSS